MESGQSVALFADNEPFRATKMWNELVKNFKSGVRVKKKRWRMKYYDDCFSGSDALAWIHDFLKFNPNFGRNVSRTQAKLLCQKLLQRNVFEDVIGQFKLRKAEFEETHLYSFVSEARIGAHDDKENSTLCKAEMSSKKIGSALKRHSSFSNKLQLSRKPLQDSKGLQNMSKDHNNKLHVTRLKPTRSSLRHNEKDRFQNIGKPAQSNVQVKGKHFSQLTRKWKSEYDVSLMKMNEESCDEGCDEECRDDELNDEQEIHNKVEQTTASNSQADCHSISHNTQKTVDDSERMCNKNAEINKDSENEEHCPQTDPNELWMFVCFERLQHVLTVNNLKDILDVDLLNWKDIMENITLTSVVADVVPKWLLSAMKCLIHWPQSVESHAVDYSGFENDIFKTIQEHFELLPEPLVSSNFTDVFTKISGVISKCKLSGIRALQLVLLMLKKDKRQQLQLLLRFMIKVSNNHQLNLSSHLPTRELVIQTFVPCIFGGKNTVHEILGIRITSFLMENYAEIFKVPHALRFEVEQHIAFRKGKNDGKHSKEVAFCLRVTKQEYEEQKQIGTERFLEDLLNSIVNDEKINEKERKKKLKQFQKTYPAIYFSRYPPDGLSMMSQQLATKKLGRVMKPLTRRHVKNFR